MAHIRLLTLRALALFVVVSLSFPVVVDAKQAGRGKSSKVSAKSGRSRSASPKRTTSRRHTASARHATSQRRTSSRRSVASPKSRRANSGRSSARTNRTNAGQSSRSRKSSANRSSPSRNVARRPASHASSTSVRAPSSSSRGQRRQITPRRVVRNTQGRSTSRPSRSTNRGSHNTAVARDAHSTVTETRRSGSRVVVIGGGGRTRSNANNPRRTSGRHNEGRGTSTSGAIVLDNTTNTYRDRSTAGRSGGRRFYSGHGAVGAPFAGSMFISENVSRYGRAHDRNSGFRDGSNSRSVRLHPSESNGSHDGRSRGHGNNYGHTGYRQGYVNLPHADDDYYFGSHYYGRRHDGYYDAVYYPTYGYYGYGYGYPYSYRSTYPFTSSSINVDVYTQPYYEVDPVIEQIYEDVVSVSPSDAASLPPAPSGGIVPVPSAPLVVPQAGANQSLPPVEQVQIPQSVVDGHQAFARGDVDKAQHEYLTAVLTNNEDGYAKLFYAMASVSAKKYDVASLALRGALRQASELVTEPIDLRQFYNDADQATKDLNALTVYSSSHDDDIDAQFLLAYFYYSMGQADDAQRVLMLVDGSAYEKDATMKELRDAVSAVISRPQDQP